LQEIASPAGIYISGAVREQTEGKLDFHLSAIGERSLKNIPRRVLVHRVEWDAEAGLQTDVLSSRALALPDKPSIAVLPFVNMSGDRDQAYFADGVTEDFEAIFGGSEEESQGKIEFAGVTFAEPGGEGSALTKLDAGSYAMVCFVPVGGGEDGPPHVSEGMFKEFTVE